LLVLQIAQEKAIEEEAALCIVESDVTVKPDTLQTLFDETLQRPDCGMSAAITTDAEGIINYPYLYAQEGGNSDFSTEECLSFCCTILSLPFLQKYSFNQLNPAKDWHDAVLTKVSLKLAFRNYLFPHLPVLHSPHGSRPWRKFKEKNLFKYYLYKFTGRRHKMVDPSSN
ncbi:glycosyltransferase family 2 protein, partial [Parabacteroides sp. 52]